MSSGTIGAFMRRIRGMVGAPVGEESTDGQLLRRFAEGHDHAAFETLLQRHGPLVLALCRRVLGDAHDAEDAFQATFLVLARRASTLDRQGTVAGWLYTVAYHIALRAKADAVRRRERERRVAPVPRTETADDLRPILDEELRRLPDKYRLPVVLCYLEGKTQEEAAGLLGWTKGTVSGRLARARETLRGRLTRRGLTPDVCALPPIPSGVVPALLREGTLAAVSRFATGQTVVGTAMTLAQVVIRRMALVKAMTLAAGVLVVATFAAGAGVLMVGMTSASPEVPPVKEIVVDTAKLDLLGDPLPPHAVARLGTVRLAEGRGTHTAAFSPDGKLLASDGHFNRWGDGTIHLWNVSTGKEVRQLPGVAGCLDFSPDSRSLAATDAFGRLGLWDVTTGVSPWTWDVSSEKDADKNSLGFVGVAFAPDGKSLAVTVSDGTIRICATATGKERLRFQAKASGVTFAPDGKTLASSEFIGKMASLWDPATGKRLHTLTHPDDVRSLAFSPDSLTLVAHGGGNWVILWDVKSGKEARTVNAPGVSRRVRFTPDGKHLRSGPWSFDLASGQETWAPWSNGSAFAHSPDGRLWATDSNGALSVWDTTTEREVVTLDRHHGAIEYLIPSADGKSIRTVGQYDKTIREWTLPTGKYLGKTGMSPWPRFGALSADGKVLATPHYNKEYALLELSSGNLSEGGEVNDRVGAMALSADAGCLAVASGEKTRVIRLWDTRNGKKLHTIEAKGEPFSSLAISPDGKTLAGASSLDRIELWDVATGIIQRGPAWQAQVRERPSEKSLRPPARVGDFSIVDPKAEPSPAAGLVFSPSGKTLAVTSGYHYRRWAGSDHPDSGLVRLYDMATGKERFQLGDQEAFIAFSPDGATLATAGHRLEFCTYPGRR
jgi:RNA polymerase sigma factor (sigma-70 family)